MFLLVHSRELLNRTRNGGTVSSLVASGITGNDYLLVGQTHSIFLVAVI
jgi:hypothetical protein